MTLAALALSATLISLIAMTAATASAGSLRTTFLLSRSYNGGIPNGESRNGTISRDQRIARVAGFESDASNIVRGDDNGVTDVFMVKRGRGWGQNGTPWRIGKTTKISNGLGGKAANGPSYKPAVAGSSFNLPTCMAFISEATNLVGNDTNGVADAFVYNFKNRRITRVSVSSTGQQANGPTTEVTVNANCGRIGFVSTATNLGYDGGGKSRWSTAAVKGGSGGNSQVYVHIRSGRFQKLTFMASASNGKKAGNSDSYQVSFARYGNQVAFTSKATNLAGNDRDAGQDVYVRQFSKSSKLRFSTRLVSQKNGRRGNKESSHPSINESGQFVAFQTDASNLLGGDSNRTTDIAQADLRTRRMQWVSKSIDGPANGPSGDPTITGGGEFVLFDSDATNLRPSRDIRFTRNGVQNFMLWNKPTRHVSVESRDHNNEYLTGPSENPATSLRGNYVLFQSETESVDRLIRNMLGFKQVYLRYLGPK
jgi:hypothetical protein